jgi:type I restriction enzyme, S subunit
LKPTALPWIPEVGDAWETHKVAHGFADVGSGTTPDTENATYYGGDIPWVTPGELRESLITTTTKMVTHRALRECSALKVFPEGTLLIAMYGATIGRLGVLGTPACLNQACCALGGGTSLEARFVYYWFIGFRENVIQLGSGGGQPNISQEKVRSLRIPAPGRSLQLRIADFLDRKTAAIDALIAKKEWLIELLQEKRQALITQAVTKGLDPNVPMKDSGVEWLGQVPAHWTVRRLKHLGKIRSGIAKGRDVADKATIARPYLRVANVQNGWLNLEDVASIEVTREEASRYALRNGDVLMNEGGDFDKLGRGYVWEGQIAECIHQNHVFAVRPWRTVNPYWVNIATQASYLRHFFILRSKQSTNLASISSTNLGEAPIPMPPTAEVDDILRGLRTALEKIDRLSATVATHIEKLREYRQALIPAAVTGKIGVCAEAA